MINAKRLSVSNAIEYIERRPARQHYFGGIVFFVMFALGAAFMLWAVAP